MARKRRVGQLDLNFDGLTDAVTNLVGALILLVLLIIGVSRQALSQQTRTQEEPPPPERTEGGTRPILPLQQRIAAMQGQIQAVDAEIRSLDGRLEGLRTDVEDLLDQVRRISPPAPSVDEPEEESEAETREVQFRPPLERRVAKDELSFVIENGRLSVIDWQSLNEQLNGAIGVGTGPMPVDLDLVGMDFRVVGSVSNDGIDLALVRQKDGTGEAIEQSEAPDSRFQRRLQELDRDAYAVNFMVYPDSYEAFRRARSVAWSMGFDVGWNQYSAGEEIRLGSGVGGSATVN